MHVCGERTGGGVDALSPETLEDERGRPRLCSKAISVREAVRAAVRPVSMHSFMTQLPRL